MNNSVNPDVQNLEHLLDFVVKFMPVWHNAFEQHLAFVGPSKGPQLPPGGRFDSADELVRFREARTAWEQQKATADQEWRDIDRRYQDLLAILRRAIPTETWVRHGAFGVGISYTNWGGNRYGIEVEPWADNMPSLNHRYTGD